MNYLMDSRPDSPEAETAPGFPPMSLWQRCVAYAVIPAVALWLTGEAYLHVRAHTELPRPTSTARTRRIGERGTINVSAPASR